MKGKVLSQKGLVEYDSKYKQEAMFFPENQTYAMNGFVSGLIIDIWSMLEDKLNFTTQLFKDKTSVWGNAIKLTNGTIITTGVVNDLHKKKADVAVASVTLTSLRLHFISYLPPLHDDIVGIVIPNSAITESLDFFLFFKPLQIHLWMMIAVFIVLFTILKYLTDRNGFHLWSSFMVMFGGAPNEDTSGFRSKKVVVFISMLAGMIVWTSYNASFTSELASVERVYPFTDLDTLSMSNWRYVCL